MATRKPTDTHHTDPLPGEDEMEQLYRAVARPKARTPFGGHWAIPLSVAAVIVLSLGVVMLLSEQGALNHRDVSVPLTAEAPQALTSNSAATPAASEYELAATEPPAKVQTVMPDTVQGVATPSVARSSAPEAKKSERIADARANSRLAKEAGGMRGTADVTTVQASGQSGAYRFSVGIRSPDKGCSQYADWWEVVSTDGKLLYRRVLLHSHVSEQPFTRSGGPVPIQPDTVVWVRAHMNTGGYGGVALKGSVNAGFTASEMPAGFAAKLAAQPPLPDGCAF